MLRKKLSSGRGVIHIKREAREKFKSQLESEHTWLDGCIITEIPESIEENSVSEQSINLVSEEVGHPMPPNYLC